MSKDPRFSWELDPSGLVAGWLSLRGPIGMLRVLGSALFRFRLLERRDSMVWKQHEVTEIKPEPVFVTLNETSETAMDSQVGSGNTYLVPSGGTVDAHRFANITVARLEDAVVIVSRHVPGGSHERYQGP